MKTKTPPAHSEQVVRTYPAPRREMYFNGADYAAACKRCHDKRVAFDTLRK